MADKRHEIIDTLIDAFQSRLKEWGDPWNHPDVTWEQVEKARRNIEQALDHNPDLKDDSGQVVLAPEEDDE